MEKIIESLKETLDQIKDLHILARSIENRLNHSDADKARMLEELSKIKEKIHELEKEVIRLRNLLFVWRVVFSVLAASLAGIYTIVQILVGRA